MAARETARETPPCVPARRWLRARPERRQPAGRKGRVECGAGEGGVRHGRAGEGGVRRRGAVLLLTRCLTAWGLRVSV